MQTEGERVLIYTDGACSPNPGKGGYGAILVENGTKREISGGFKMTTNNRMELLSIIKALSALDEEGLDVTVFSDSRYVVDAFSGRKAHLWQRQNWMRTKRDAAKNPDLWQRLLEVCARHRVEMRWVAGHAGQPENERCDQLAVEARLRDDLEKDEGYLSPFIPEHGTQTQLELFS